MRGGTGGGGGGGGGGRVCIQIVEDSPYQRTTLKDYLFILMHQLQSGH